MAWAVVQGCWLKEQVSQVEDEAPLRSDACHSYLKSEIRLMARRRVLKAVGHDGTYPTHLNPREQAHRRHG